MLGITAGMDQKDSGASCRKTADFRSRSSSQVVDFLLRCRGLFPWSWCSADHRVSPVAPVHVVDVPVMQVVQLPRWFAVLGHADDMPLLATTCAWSWTV